MNKYDQQLNQKIFNKIQTNNLAKIIGAPTVEFKPKDVQFIVDELNEQLKASSDNSYPPSTPVELSIASNPILIDLIKRDMNTLKEFDKLSVQEVQIIEREWHTIFDLLEFFDESRDENDRVQILNETIFTFNSNCAYSPDFLKYSLLIESVYESIINNIRNQNASIFLIPAFNPLASSVAYTSDLISGSNLTSMHSGIDTPLPIPALSILKHLDSIGFNFDWLMLFKDRDEGDAWSLLSPLLVLADVLPPEQYTQYIDLVYNNSLLLKSKDTLKITLDNILDYNLNDVSEYWDNSKYPQRSENLTAQFMARIEKNNLNISVPSVSDKSASHTLPGFKI